MWYDFFSVYISILFCNINLNNDNNKHGEKTINYSILGTFQSVQGIVKESMNTSLMDILTPSRRVDIIRDVREAKANNRPYVITFCGVNGVGKSTNLAKICFWLVENKCRVLIAACDTFR